LQRWERRVWEGIQEIRRRWVGKKVWKGEYGRKTGEQEEGGSAKSGKGEYGKVDTEQEEGSCEKGGKGEYGKVHRRAGRGG
jgi:hypothetical protein